MTPLLVILAVLLSAQPASPAPPDVVVRAYKGKPAVFIDGVPHALPGYSTFTREAFDEDLPRFYAHGMGVYFIEPPKLWWDGGAVIRDHEVVGDANVISLDEMAERILAGDPDAWIIVRFTPRAPREWQQAHPEEYFVTEEPDPTLRPTPSLASDLFWATMADLSAAVIRHVESRPWAERVIGYANFHVTEGTHAPVHQAWLFDQNPLMREKYRAHLRAKYPSERALQAAYGDATMTFDTATIPADRLRGSVPDVSQLDYWQDATSNRPLRDYLELQARLWHRHTGMAVREHGQGAARSVDGIGSRGPGDYAEVFVAAVPLPAAIWRNVARFAGAHVYSESNDVLLANSSVVALHSAYSGPRTIRLPGTYRVRDLISGQRLDAPTDTISFDLDAPETRLFLLER